MTDIQDRHFLRKNIKDEKYELGLDFLKDRPLSTMWCDCAVSIYVTLNKIGLAKETLAWAKRNADLLIWRRCIYEYAKVLWIKLWGNSPDNLLITPGINDEKILNKIDEILCIIHPVIQHIQGDEAVQNKLESKILFIAINSFWIKGNIEKVQTLASYLTYKKPASLGLANLALLGLVNKKNLSPNFPDRLIEDHPDSFNALMLSKMIQAEIFGHAEKAFNSLKSYSTSICSENNERFIEGLLQIAKLTGEVAIQETLKLSDDILGENNTIGRLTHAEILLNDGKIEDAEKIIIEHKNEKNPVWLQLNSFLQIEKGNIEEAIECFEKVSQQIVHPEIFSTFGKIATKASEKDSRYLYKVVEAYKNLIDLQPDNIGARHNIAFALTKAGEFQNAEKHFKYLSEHSPDIIYKQNFAYCLLRQDKYEKALNIYDTLCASDEAPVEVIVQKTNILRQLETPKNAFTFLDSYRDKFWDDPLYLQCFIDTAYKADRDHKAHKALMRLRELQNSGELTTEIIQEKTIDDFKDYFEAQNKRKAEVNKFYLKGQLPWIFVDTVLGEATYTGWFVRTQELGWISEDPTEVARFSIYSTNALHPLQSHNEKVYIEKIEKPSFQSEVILDISAFITLHKLNLLHKAYDFFESFIVPSVYLTKLASDSNKLLFHQLSYVEAIRKIKKSIDNQNIEVLDDFGTQGNRTVPYVNEHTIPEADDEEYYRIRDVIGPLIQEGLLKKRILQDIDKFSLKPAMASTAYYPPLELNSTIVIDPSSLRTLNELRLYDIVLKNFQVALSEDLKNQIINDFLAIQNQEKSQEINKQLRNHLSIAKFEKIDVPKIDTSKDENDFMDFSLASYSLWELKKVPLFVDCRVVQMQVLNDRSNNVAFGTDLFLSALFSNGLITIEEYTTYFLKLIDWRYKFLIPPLSILNYLADQYSHKPPGIELNRLAIYIQDCMHDPGLFYCHEKSAEVPLPISIKYYLELINLTVYFIVDCWTKSSLSDDEAEKFTDWALFCLLPTVPKFLPEYSKSNISKTTNGSILNGAIMRLITIKNSDIANKILLTLKSKLQINDLEYNNIVAEALNAIR